MSFRNSELSSSLLHVSFSSCQCRSDIFPCNAPRAIFSTTSTTSRQRRWLKSTRIRGTGLPKPVSIGTHRSRWYRVMQLPWLLQITRPLPNTVRKIMVTTERSHTQSHHCDPEELLYERMNCLSNANFFEMQSSRQKW